MDERSRNEERKLELRLGPPGTEDWSLNDKTNTERDESLLSLGYFSTTMPNSNNNGFQSKYNIPPSDTPWSSSGYHHYQSNNNKASSFLQFSPSPPVMGSKEATASQTCCPRVVELQNNGADKKVFCPPSSAANTAVQQPNSSQKRYPPQLFPYLMSNFFFVTF